MENEESKMDCTTSTVNHLSKKFRVLLYIAIFYTGIISLWGAFSIGRLFDENILWKGTDQQSINSIIWENMIYLVIMFSFVSLIKIAVTKKPFSGILVNCLYAIGILILIVAKIVQYGLAYQKEIDMIV